MATPTKFFTPSINQPCRDVADKEAQVFLHHVREARKSAQRLAKKTSKTSTVPIYNVFSIREEATNQPVFSPSDLDEFNHGIGKVVDMCGNFLRRHITSGTQSDSMEKS